MIDKSHLDNIKKRIVITESELKELCTKLKELFLEDPNVIKVSAPVNIVGDVHGQFYDVLNMFSIIGDPSGGSSFLFLGDYVDRGHFSVETIEYLFILKILYPDKIFLIRGNHEMRQITMTYGFYNECIQKYGNVNAWRYICDVFDYLPISAVVGQSILGVHGGLSPDLAALDQIQTLDRFHEVPNIGRYADLLWSDPEENYTGFGRNPRGCGYIFGQDVTNQFCYWNNIDLICRAHQLARDGYQFFFENQNVVIVWSAPNYCYREKNLASVMSLDENLNRTFTLYRDTVEPEIAVEN